MEVGQLNLPIPPLPGFEKPRRRRLGEQRTEKTEANTMKTDVPLPPVAVPLSKGAEQRTVKYYPLLAAVFFIMYYFRVWMMNWIFPTFSLFCLYRVWVYWRELSAGRPFNFKTLKHVRDAVRKNKKKLPGFKEGFITVRDGTRLYYQRVGFGAKVIFMANGLGAREWMWLNFMQHAKPHLHQFTFVSWDYRGMFASGAPPPGKLSIRDHAEDLLDLMNILGVSRAHTILGWSTGVQVGLQFAAMYGERVDRLVLLNGAHGHVFASGLQPIVPFPIIGEVLAWLPTLLRSYSEPLWQAVGNAIYKYETLLRYLCRPYAVIYGNPLLEWSALLYLADTFNYQEGENRHTHFMFQTFHELHAHSIFHLLPEIQTRTLILGGVLDALTPVYHSFSMHARLPNSQLYVKPFATHFMLFEYPDDVSRRVLKFLNEDADNFYISQEEFDREVEHAKNYSALKKILIQHKHLTHHSSSADNSSVHSKSIEPPLGDGNFMLTLSPPASPSLGNNIASQSPPQSPARDIQHSTNTKHNNSDDSSAYESKAFQYCSKSRNLFCFILWTILDFFFFTVHRENRRERSLDQYSQNTNSTENNSNDINIQSTDPDTQKSLSKTHTQQTIEKVSAATPMSNSNYNSHVKRGCPYNLTYSTRDASALKFGARVVMRSGLSNVAAGSARLLRQHLIHRMQRNAYRCVQGLCDCLLAEDVCFAAPVFHHNHQAEFAHEDPKHQQPQQQQQQQQQHQHHQSSKKVHSTVSNILINNVYQNSTHQNPKTPKSLFHQSVTKTPLQMSQRSRLRSHLTPKSEASPLKKSPLFSVANTNSAERRLPLLPLPEPMMMPVSPSSMHEGGGVSQRSLLALSAEVKITGTMSPTNKPFVSTRDAFYSILSDTRHQHHNHNLHQVTQPSVQPPSFSMYNMRSASHSHLESISPSSASSPIKTRRKSYASNSSANSMNNIQNINHNLIQSNHSHNIVSNVSNLNQSSIITNNTSFVQEDVPLFSYSNNLKQNDQSTSQVKPLDVESEGEWTFDEEDNTRPTTVSVEYHHHQHHNNNNINNTVCTSDAVSFNSPLSRSQHSVNQQPPTLRSNHKKPTLSEKIAEERFLWFLSSDIDKCPDRPSVM